MSDMSYLKNKPIAVIGGGAVGKTIAADCKLAVGDSQEVRLFDAMPFAAKTLKNLEKTGINFDTSTKGNNRSLFHKWFSYY